MRPVDRFIQPVIVCLILSGFVFVLSVGATVTASPVAFGEIWAYLLDGEERFLEKNMPVTDVGYFGAGLNTFGKLIGVPNRSKLSSWSGRVHLVIAETGNHSLTHLVLNPEYPVRTALITDIVTAAAPYEGVQIDFEAVHARDREHFISFLADLKRRLGSKTLSVALPARWRPVDDAYDYPRIAAVVDRIIVMAYDEHWSGSKAGSIASLDWCERVARYARASIGEAKLVMGLPFYGRAWADTNPSRAYRHSTLSTLIAEKGIQRIDRKAEIPYFEYDQLVRVQVYFEDLHSLVTRFGLYSQNQVRHVAFWRLGQEDSAIWSRLRTLE